MGKVSVDYDGDVPRYACTNCSNCSSLMGESLCQIKSRGCCWYYPKFTLVDIHRMVKSLEGLQILNTIRQNQGSIIYKYYIHSKGFFDKTGYDEYIKGGQVSFYEELNEGEKDYTTFFRACSFVKPGYGCTIPPRFRTYICNFFICSDIFDENSPSFKPYVDERLNYSKWIEWENAGLEHILIENNATLEDDFEKVIMILQDIPLSIYEFPYLAPVETDDTWYKGA